MADMGFMPPVEWILRHVPADHQTMLFSATLDGDVDSLVRHYLTRPGPPRGALGVGDRHRRWSTAFLLVHQLDKVKVTAAIAGRRPSGRWSSPGPSAAPTTSAEQLRREGVDVAAIHGDLRQQIRETGAQGLRRRQAAGPGRHRRGRPGHPRRRHRHRRALRPARGPEGLPPPFRPHRPGRRGGRGGHPRAVGPAARRRAHPAPARPPPAGRGGLLQRSPTRRPARLGSAAEPRWPEPTPAPGGPAWNR